MCQKTMPMIARNWFESLAPARTSLRPFVWNFISEEMPLCGPSSSTCHNSAALCRGLILPGSGCLLPFADDSNNSSINKHRHESNGEAQHRGLAQISPNACEVQIRHFRVPSSTVHRSQSH